jgi:hypothetical protein
MSPTITATLGTLMLLNRLGTVRWDWIQGDMRWHLLAVMLLRLASIAMLLAARERYLRSRHTFYAALKAYALIAGPYFLRPGLKQMGPHSWAILGGRDGRVEPVRGIVRALLLPTGAHSCLNDTVLPPFRLPWRLMAPLHLLHGAHLVCTTHRDVVRLLGLFPQLGRDARTICEAVHDATFLLTGLVTRGSGESGGPCAGAKALSWTALFSSAVLVLLVPLVYAYAGARPCCSSWLARLLRAVCRFCCASSHPPLPKGPSCWVTLPCAWRTCPPPPQPSARPSAPSCTGSCGCGASCMRHGARTSLPCWPAACWRTPRWTWPSSWAWCDGGWLSASRAAVVRATCGSGRSPRSRNLAAAAGCFWRRRPRC